MPRALITGITGQDGQHLAELLNSKGYDVFGLVKGQNNPRIAGVLEQFPFVEPVSGDLADLSSLVKAIGLAQPDEVYNLGAVSYVAYSFTHAELTADISGLGVLRMLDAVRMVGGSDDNSIRFYQASTSEMFGEVRETPQTEMTPFHPRSPYGCAKVFGHYITMNYRESYDMFACSGILFNHEGRGAGSNSSLARSPMRLLASNSVFKMRSFLEISIQSVTGDMRVITSVRCGSCCNMTPLKIL